MRVGILGSGLMGGKLGTIFARAGHEVVFSYARSPQKLQRLASDVAGNAPPQDPRTLPATLMLCCSRCTGQKSMTCSSKRGMFPARSS